MIHGQTRAIRWALSAGAIALVLAFGADRWYAAETATVERERVRTRMLPFANALRNAIDRRVGILRGFHSFVTTRRTRRDLDEQFPVFARGAVASASGVRALQWYENGPVTAIEPLDPNRGALGFDPSRDPRAEVRGDHQRVLAARGPVVTGPFALVEGGIGILLRQRITDRPGFPQVVAVLLDAPAIVADAGIPDSTSGLRLAVVNADRGWSGGDELDPSQEPVSLRIELEGTAWVLNALPAPGWRGDMSAWRWSFRAALAGLVLLVAIVGLVLGDRLDQLARAREHSDSALAVAMRAGRLGAWALHLESGRLDVSGATAAFLGPDVVQREDAVAFVLDLMPIEDRRRLRALYDEVRNGARENVATEFRLVRPDGAVRTLLAVGQVVLDAAGKPDQLVGVLSNVTERRAMEARLQQSERLESVGKLAGGVAHDFNNLLAAMGSFAQIAVEHMRSLKGNAAAEIAADLEQVLDRTRTGTQLTSQLLAFSRRAPGEPARVDVGATLADLQPVLARLFAGPMTLRVDPSNGLPAVRVVPSLLTQVILSLLVRARDAQPGPVRVHVRTVHVPATSGPRPLDAPIGQWVCIEIAEEGQRPTSVAAAARTAPAPRRMTPGAGLALVETDGGWGIGLAVLASGLESAGGRLVSDATPRTGSVTRIFLPLWEGK